MNSKISPSLMCADLFRLGDTLRIFEENDIEYLHVDIMDGHFVPNFTLGTDFCRTLKKRTSIPLDIHLMTEKPEEMLSWFDFGENDIVSVHYEASVHLQKALTEIRKRGARPFVALNPATSPDVLDYVLDDIDGVVVMAVNPGFAGQKLIPSAIEKIRYLRRKLDESGHPGISIEVDGNVSFENAVRMKQAGADIFVAGTSAIFSPSLTLSEGIAEFREATGEKS